MGVKTRGGEGLFEGDISVPESSSATQTADEF